MAAALYASDYLGDLGNGLVRRWSTAADVEKIGLCLATVYRGKADEPLNHRMLSVMAVMFSPGFPLMGPGDFALVEDTTVAERPIVACTCLWRQRWSLGGISFGVGRPEYVATREAYRNRGLVRALFEMLHARSEAAGDLVQAITGIPYYYRQFGYEYALDLGGRRVVPLAVISPQKTGEEEVFRLRPATAEDAPQMAVFYNQRQGESLVWSETTADHWRFYVTAWDLPAVQQEGVLDSGVEQRLYMIVDAQGAACGFTGVAARRWGRELYIGSAEMGSGANWQAVMPSLLRGWAELAPGVPMVTEPGKPQEPVSALSLGFGRSHPAYDVLGKLAAHYDPPYAWYVRVPDLEGFVRHIAPVIEERLAQSILHGYSGELKFDFYRGGLLLRFTAGKLAVEPWQAPAYGDVADAGCPQLVFLQLLLGHRSFAELHENFPDVWTKAESTLLVNTVFPKQPSQVWSVSYT